MNLKNDFKLVGRVLLAEGGMMLLPLVAALIYREPFINCLAFLAPAAALGAIGLISLQSKGVDKDILPKDGLFIVGCSWLLMSLFGCVPFLINGEIPRFVDALFETSSGFTTTGASILPRVEDLSHSSLFWRSFSHWIGGMGILVLVLAFMPKSRSGSGASLYVLRAESPGPSVGKLVAKMTVTTRILYIIYSAMTLLLTILLVLNPQIDLFTALCLAFGTAGTGGFATLSTSLATYGPYVQYVVAIFMILFGVNFTLYYYILIKKWRQTFRSEELRAYLGIIVVAVFLIAVTIYRKCGDIYPTAEEAFRHAFFQTASIMTTTGFATTDFAAIWPVSAQLILIVLMIIGAMAGSTGGGVKVSRILIAVKCSAARLKKLLNPRRVTNVKEEGRVLSDEFQRSVLSFLVLYGFIVCLGAFLISFDGLDIVSDFTASLACISNIGPGLGAVGPMGNYASFGDFSKIVLSLEMMAGRLELFPIIVLFYPASWRKV